MLSLLPSDTRTSQQHGILLEAALLSWQLSSHEEEDTAGAMRILPSRALATSLSTTLPGTSHWSRAGRALCIPGVNVQSHSL